MKTFDLPAGSRLKVIKTTPRKEMHGPTPVQAISLRLEWWPTDNAALNMLADGLQDVLFYVPPEAQGQETLDGIHPAKKWRRCPELAMPLSLRLEATGMTLGEVIEHCKTIGAPGETLLRKAGGGAIEMSSLSARFREHIVAVCGPDAYQRFEWPSLHEVRSLSARTYIAEGMEPATVQTLLGHKHAEMTKVYLDDRGLTEAEWKTVDAQQRTPAANDDAQRAAA